MAVDPPNVLSDLRLDALKNEVVDRVQRVREDELRPREDAQLVARRIEVVPARQLVRRLVDPPAPNAQLRRRASRQLPTTAKKIGKPDAKRERTMFCPLRTALSSTQRTCADVMRA